MWNLNYHTNEQIYETNRYGLVVGQEVGVWGSCPWTTLFKMSILDYNRIFKQEESSTSCFNNQGKNYSMKRVLVTYI